MKNLIKIKTALHDGIYKSSGGGQTTTAYSYNVGPLNLLRAVKQLHEHYQSMERSYGSVGHQGSWIEINGLSINHDELPETLSDAKQLIADVESGELVKSRKNFADYMEHLDHIGHVAFQAGANGEPMPHDFDEYGVTPYEVESGYRAGRMHYDAEIIDGDDDE